MRNRNAPHTAGGGRQGVGSRLRLDAIIPHLRTRRFAIRDGMRHVQAHCPCHEDSNASLSLTEKPDGTLLVKCFAGCEQETVWRELCRLAGVEPERAVPVLPAPRPQAHAARNGSTPAPAESSHERLTVDAYAHAKGLNALLLREWGLIECERGIAIPYLDADGNCVATRYRFALDGENRFAWERGNRPCLYGLWRLREWREGETLYLCEGETDTLTLWRAGLPALGIPGASVWRESWWEPLARFARIVVIPDADAAGRQLVEKLAHTCPLPLQERVEVLELPEGVKDANELWLQVGCYAERFREELANRPLQPLSHFLTYIESEKVRKCPTPLDLAERQPQPTQWLVKQLIPARHATNLYGDSGTCKSLLALHLALCVIEGVPFLGHTVHKRGKVLYLDLELDAEVHTARWWAVAEGAGYTEPPKGLRYVRMRELLSDLPALHALIEQEQPALVIIDSFGKAVGDPLDPQLAIRMYDLIDTLPVPVLVIDHIAKPTADTPAEATREYGTVYKRHYARSAIQVDLQGRESGRVAIILRQQKSNFGAVAAEIPLTVEIESEDDLLLTVRFLTGSAAVAQNADLFGRRGEVLRYLQENGESTAKAIAEGAGIPSKTLYRLLKLMEQEGLIEESPDTYPKRYRLRGDFLTFSPQHEKVRNCPVNDSEPAGTNPPESSASGGNFLTFSPLNKSEKVRKCDAPAEPAPAQPFQSRASLCWDSLDDWQRAASAELEPAELDAVRVMLAFAEARGFPALTLHEYGYTIAGDLASWLTAAQQLAGTPAVALATHMLHELHTAGSPAGATDNTDTFAGGTTPAQPTLLEG